MSALDIQIGGGHYKSMAIQPMEFSMANKLDACQHTAIKYITRFREKAGVEDLRKAIHCIEMLIEFEEREQAAEANKKQAMGAVADGGLESFNGPDRLDGLDEVLDALARKRKKQLAGPPSFAKPAPAPVEPNKDPNVCDTFWPVEANSPWCSRCGYSRQKHSQHAVEHGMSQGVMRGVAYGGNATAPVFPQPLNPEDNK